MVQGDSTYKRNQIPGKVKTITTIIIIIIIVIIIIIIIIIMIIFFFNKNKTSFIDLKKK